MLPSLSHTPLARSPRPHCAARHHSFLRIFAGRDGGRHRGFIEVRTAQMGLGQPVPPPEGRGLQAARDPHGNRGSPRRANRLGRGRGRVAGLTRLLLVLKNKYI